MGNYMNFLFNPNGRVSRKDIWIKFALVYILVTIVAGVLDYSMGFVVVEWFGLAVSLFYAWPGIAVPVKRFHDRGMTGWWVLIGWIAIIIGLAVALSPFYPLFAESINNPEAIDEAAYEEVLLVGSNMGIFLLGMLIIFATGLFFFIVNYCLAGHKGLNKYGPDPLDPLAATADAFN